MDARPTAREVRTVWPADVMASLPAFAINQMSVQVAGSDGPDEVIVLLGHAAGPVLSGDDEERQEQAAALMTVQVQPVFRMSLTPSRLREFVNLLQTVVRAIDEEGDA